MALRCQNESEAGSFAALGTLALTSVTPALAASGQLVQTSSDPYTNLTSNHKTEVEPDTFAFGHTIVSAFQVGRFLDGGASNIGWATSTNGGSTWKPGFLPGTTTFVKGSYARVSDPSVAFDAKHNVWLISYLGLLGTSAADLLVSRSIDGGVTWGNPIVVDRRGTTTSQLLDKNWTVCDDTASSPFYGPCYTEYENNRRIRRPALTSSWGSSRRCLRSGGRAYGRDATIWRNRSSIAFTWSGTSSIK